jgi:hypothetical protein
VTTQRGFATFPTPFLWIMALFFGIPALYDVATELGSAPLQDVLLNFSELVLGAFLLYCAVQVYRGKRAALASRRTTIVGNVCLGLFMVCFVVKIGATAVAIGLFGI